MELVLAFGCVTLGIVALVRDRREVDRLEDKIREIRTVLAADFPYRLPERDDHALEARLQAAVAQHAALVECGMRSLGNLVMELPGGQPLSIMRAFVDPDLTTVAYLTVYPGNDLVSLLLESYATEGEYITHVGNPVRASPPFSHHQTLNGPLPFRTILERHRRFASAANIRITSLDELMRELRRNHAMFKRWRESMSPDDLLEADLRTVLGEAYLVHGARWKRRLALRLPQATLRR